jgi:SRSO17 transposase
LPYGGESGAGHERGQRSAALSTVDQAGFRDYLTQEKLLYAVSIRSNIGVWWGKRQHQPIAVKALVNAIKARWRRDSNDS